MKKLIVMFLAIIAGICAFAQTSASSSLKGSDKSYTKSGNTFTAVKAEGVKPTEEKTAYTWKDTKGNEYPIYISKKGSAYVYKTSTKTGEQYKYYLGKQLSQDICKELGREYVGRTNSK